MRAVPPLSLAFACGATLCVAPGEQVPESHSHGSEHEATFGLVAGFALLAAPSHVLL